MQLVRLPGAAYLEAGDHRLLFGSYPEIHQILMKRGLAWPDVLVFTDVLVRDRLAQMVPEFLFFGHVFVNQNFDWATMSVKRPLTFVGTANQVARATRLMDVSFLGMSTPLMDRAFDPARAAFLKRECDYFALKNREGAIIPTEAFLDPQIWDEDEQVQLGEITVQRIGMLAYRVTYRGEAVTFDLASMEKQEPSWTNPEVAELRTSHPFSLRILGSAGAFQAVAPSTSYLMTLNGEHYLIDCSPYVHRTLEHLGIAVDQIRGIFISHIHDDHTGDLIAFALANRRIDLWTTPEVWASLQIKLAAILDREEGEISAMFRFREVLPGRPLFLGGARIDVHDACHSVPCVGMTLRVGDQEVVITSDTSGHRQLQDMCGKSVISAERYEALESLLDGQTVIVDCGEAIIHGYIQDFLHRPDNSNLILAHRHTLPPEYEGIFSLARPLQLFMLGPKNESVIDTVLIGRLLETWDLGDPWSWTTLFAMHRMIREPVIGEVILHQGSRADDDYFYLITHGFFDVLANGTKVAMLRAGDFFGEQAFLHAEGTRIASVIATTPGRLLAIPGPYFKAMLRQEDVAALSRSQETLTARLLRLWENRAVISQVKLFSTLDVQTLNSFSLRLQRVEVSPSQAVIQEGERDDSACYLVMQGCLQVEKPGEGERPILRELDLFGEGVAGGFTEVRSATVRALEPCTLLKLSREDLKVIGSERPQVFFALRELVEQRNYLPHEGLGA